jgi:hypothetical protein
MRKKPNQNMLSKQILLNFYFPFNKKSSHQITGMNFFYLAISFEPRACVNRTGSKLGGSRLATNI